MSQATDYWKSQGKNFITPEALQYWDLEGGYMVELSEGTDFDNNAIFGLSIADEHGVFLSTPISGLFRSKKAALDHLALFVKLVKSAGRV